MPEHVSGHDYRRDGNHWLVELQVKQVEELSITWIRCLLANVIWMQMPPPTFSTACGNCLRTAPSQSGSIYPTRPTQACRIWSVKPYRVTSLTVPG